MDTLDRVSSQQVNKLVKKPTWIFQKFIQSHHTPTNGLHLNKPNFFHKKNCSTGKCVISSDLNWWMLPRFCTEILMPTPVWPVSLVCSAHVAGVSHQAAELPQPDLQKELLVSEQIWAPFSQKDVGSLENGSYGEEGRCRRKKLLKISRSLSHSGCSALESC